MGDKPNDVNTASEASTEANTDVNNTDVASSAASTQQSSANETKQTLENVISDVFKASQSSGEQQDKASDVQQSNSTEKENKDSVKEEAAESEDKGEKDQTEQKQEDVDKGPVPYERFAEVNKKAKELTQQFEESKPLLEAHRSVIDHCQRNNISEEQFQNWMTIAALAGTDPEKALQHLEPLVTQLKSLTGDVLPKDLQEMVDNNEIPLEVAKRLAKAESQSKFGQQRTQLTEQQLIQQKQQAFVEQMTGSFSSWQKSKMDSDPDFVPKGKPTDADGKFELFLNKFALDAKAANVQSAQELIAVAEKAYNAINSSLQKFMPKSTRTKVLLSTRSSSSTRTAPKNVDDAISAAAAKHGISFTVPTGA